MRTRGPRWALLLEEFHYTIEHRSGKNMLYVDALSRSPIPMSIVIDESSENIQRELVKLSVKIAI